MRRWFLSYNSQDLALAQGFEEAFRRKEPDARIFVAPRALRLGGFWLPELAREIAEASAFLLLVGRNGLGPWQVLEYYEALDRQRNYEGAPTDGRANEAGDCNSRVVRGGSWSTDPQTLRAADRVWPPHDFRASSSNGFRVARALAP